MKLYNLRKQARSLMTRLGLSKNKKASEMKTRLNDALHSCLGCIDEESGEAMNLQKAVDASINLRPPNVEEAAAL